MARCRRPFARCGGHSTTIRASRSSFARCRATATASCSRMSSRNPRTRRRARRCPRHAHHHRRRRHRSMTIDVLIDRLLSDADDATDEDRRDAAEQLHALGTATAIARLNARPRPARGLALLRDTRWQVGGAGDVPLLGQPGGLAAAWHLIRLRLRDAFMLAERRAISAAIGAAIAGALAGLVGGLRAPALTGHRRTIHHRSGAGFARRHQRRHWRGRHRRRRRGRRSHCAIAPQCGDHRRRGPRRSGHRRHRPGGHAVDAAGTVRSRAGPDRRTDRRV